jgi:hypothetical protein
VIDLRDRESGRQRGHDAYVVNLETIRSLDKAALGRIVLTHREHSLEVPWMRCRRVTRARASEPRALLRRRNRQRPKQQGEAPANLPV